MSIESRLRRLEAHQAALPPAPVYITVDDATRTAIIRAINRRLAAQGYGQLPDPEMETIIAMAKSIETRLRDLEKHYRPADLTEEQAETHRQRERLTMYLEALRTVPSFAPAATFFVERVEMHAPGLLDVTVPITSVSIAPDLWFWDGRGLMFPLFRDYWPAWRLINLLTTPGDLPEDFEQEVQRLAALPLDYRPPESGCTLTMPSVAPPSEPLPLVLQPGEVFTLDDVDDIEDTPVVVAAPAERRFCGWQRPAFTYGPFTRVPQADAGTREESARLLGLNADSFCDLRVLPAGEVPR